MAPEFELSDEKGGTVRLSDLRGRWVVFWWYPEAKTSGCTLEGRAFQVQYSGFQKAGAAVLGVSFNDADKNLDFAQCEGFSFPLLCDTDRSTGHAYDVVRQPDERFADKPRRVTYLISPDGTIARSYLVEDVNAHAAEVLADLLERQSVGVQG